MNNPIIPWIGGKRRLAKHILPLFPDWNSMTKWLIWPGRLKVA